MTMVDAAGDVAELSYKWVQAVDGLSGFTTWSRTGGHTASSAPVRLPASLQRPGSPPGGQPAPEDDPTPAKTGQPGLETGSGHREHGAGQAP